MNDDMSEYCKDCDPQFLCWSYGKCYLRERNERASVRSSGLVPTPESGDPVTQSRPHSDERRALRKWLAIRLRKERRALTCVKSEPVANPYVYGHVLGAIEALVDFAQSPHAQKIAPDVASETSGRRNNQI